MSDDRLIVALDVPDALQALKLSEMLGQDVSFYKIGLGMLTGGGLGLANELKQEHGKRIFLDMKLFDIGATVEKAVRGLAQFDLDFLTVHGDPHVVRAAREGASGSDMKILAVTILTSLDRDDLDAGLMRPGLVPDLVAERAAREVEIQLRDIMFFVNGKLVGHLPKPAGRLRLCVGLMYARDLVHIARKSPVPAPELPARGSGLGKERG